jgi:hypothetical protein
LGEHGQHIFFLSKKAIEFIVNTYKFAAIFINGFLVFFNLVQLEKLSALRLEIQKALELATPIFVNKLVSSGYTFAIKDNEILRSRDLCKDE